MLCVGKGVPIVASVRSSLRTQPVSKPEHVIVRAMSICPTIDRLLAVRERLPVFSLMQCQSALHAVESSNIVLSQTAGALRRREGSGQVAVRSLEVPLREH